MFNTLIEDSREAYTPYASQTVMVMPDAFASGFFIYIYVVKI